ncbi:COX15/CtaA family protein [Limnobacter humi]|uniref:COX15/CtaA family protein n=1 Tax=Limnobacter humi TaxID=1778671 RepID=A0ABT1WJI9_9BURK|nr:COX15/CtaA family protein [Limnobacter humi]MCQ8897665.1 COX15/CtaA family protein [Limnobacter humi]
MSFKRLVMFATVLTFGLIMLGAYVRLSDAGLGCPDWPGCYGKLTPSHAAADIAAAVQEQGGDHGPVSIPKAWKEMVHRYIASFLGLVIISIAVMAWRKRHELRQSPVLATALVGVVCLQGAFGAWTVTLLLKPAIVTGHLIGGMSVLGLLTWLWLRQTTPARTVSPPRDSQRLVWLARAGLLVVCAQIILGGWVSTNYAAVVCTDFPTCQGSYWPTMEFNHAFHIVRELGETPDGQLLNVSSLTAIHFTHRMGAIVVTAVLLTLALALWRTPGRQALALKVVGVLTLQIAMGIGNVVFHLPLWLAVLHNGGAALLLVTLILVNYRLASHRVIPHAGA